MRLMILRLIDSPKPVPCGFVVKNASKMRSASSRANRRPYRHRNEELIMLDPLRCDNQFAARLSHGLDAVEHEVHQNLLELDAIRPVVRGRPEVEFRTDRNECRTAVSSAKPSSPEGFRSRRRLPVLARPARKASEPGL